MNISKVIVGFLVLVCLGTFGSNQVFGQMCEEFRQEATCKSDQNCLWLSGQCTGSEVCRYSQFVFNAAACKGNPSCKWEDAGTCSGPPICAGMLRNKSACQQEKRCEWVDTAGCIGKSFKKSLKQTKKS